MRLRVSVERSSNREAIGDATHVAKGARGCKARVDHCRRAAALAFGQPAVAASHVESVVHGEAGGQPMYSDLREAGFRCYSQFEEDGIISFCTCSRWLASGLGESWRYAAVQEASVWPQT